MNTYNLFVGSRPSPDEDRLLQHLFSPQNNLLTTPVRSRAEIVEVDLGLIPVKFIDVVKPNNAFTVRLYKVFDTLSVTLYFNNVTNLSSRRQTVIQS